VPSKLKIILLPLCPKTYYSQESRNHTCAWKSEISSDELACPTRLRLFILKKSSRSYTPPHLPALSHFKGIEMKKANCENALVSRIKGE